MLSSGFEAQPVLGKEHGATETVLCTRVALCLSVHVCTPAAAVTGKVLFGLPLTLTSV